ncbi:putative 2-aminoethylphosphonate ABC transporter permease subunit [Amphritea sp. 2_MG-2023]|uniref:putative 2-aminoethylphosphonate ABC transporter permease subunit n=1 Tax=Amphritea TaxID=515417 RepID=UPI001C06DE0A|nr:MULTISPECIES: putative 2-aminoethylphosphonate ABC transporter permease subunit [Amphritea]MBU2964109.1 putative 2-aminoethylphosphonate ABC transporter permease subunit [Amphritea atlantica]MDO6418507.1 putative 2-aminoethylphosphonate ABC transporter permease subunit [Amphritea sp. 2_MG-2023]MDX2422937.1 putative 2-aminoethylphosphonate ABC transporter permease subunit [Amphritea sp.]
MSSIAQSTQVPPVLTKPKLSPDDWVMRTLIIVAIIALFTVIVLPLYSMLAKSAENSAGEFIGLANFITYFNSPALFKSITNSLFVSGTSSITVLFLAFLYAYALTRTCMRCKAFFNIVALIPLLAPSLLSAISLVYVFGNQGIAKSWLFGESIYGPIGIIIGLVIWVFPSALMIIKTSLQTTDGRLYEAATAMRSTPLRTFLVVTLPGVKYGLISALFIVFTLTVTDFGVAKVIGGQYNVLATDLFKQVIGQQNFQMGAVVGIVLLFPAVLAFIADRYVQRKQVSLLSARSVPYTPKPSTIKDNLFFIYCTLVSAVLIGMLAMAAYASFVTFWPYDQSLSLTNYQFDLMDGGGWGAFTNSLRMALYTAVFGTLFIFGTAYLVEKCRGFKGARTIIQMFTLLPMAVPGMVLGLSYIFFFNAPNNPLNFLYGSMAIMVISCVVHFYTVSHITAVTALKQMDPEFESVGASLKVPLYKTFFRVTLPMCLPAVLDISTYLFTTAMTTVSAVIFLYSPDTQLASVAVLNMEGAGDIAPAAAMAMMIVLTSACVRLLHYFLTRGLRRKHLLWRTK